MQPAKRIRRRGKIPRLEADAWYRPSKRQVCLRLDADILAWFKRGGRGYQTRINRALRKLMKEEGAQKAPRTQVSKNESVSKLGRPCGT